MYIPALILFETNSCGFSTKLRKRSHDLTLFDRLLQNVGNQDLHSTFQLHDLPTLKHTHNYTKQGDGRSATSVFVHLFCHKQQLHTSMALRLWQPARRMKVGQRSEGTENFGLFSASRQREKGPVKKIARAAWARWSIIFKE